MKIAVSATKGDLEATVDPRFGRCAYFVIVEVEGGRIKDFEVVENKAAMAFGGAGIQAAQIVANKGAEIVITGNMGPNAFAALSMAGIKVVVGATGMKVKQAVEMYLKGELTETKVSAPAVGMPPIPPGRGRFRGPPAECVCPNCGFRMPHQRGIPCSQHICPRCGTRMVRG